MKKIALLLLVAMLASVLAACELPITDGTTSATTSATTSGDPYAASPSDLTQGDTDGKAVVSCTQIAVSDRERTYRLTFADGSTTDFKVKDGKGGADATGITVTSCTPVYTNTNKVTTWRITFSNNTVTDFKVSNATPMNADIDWEALITKLEEMTDLLSVTRPDMEVGTSTVTDTTKTVAAVYSAPNPGAAYITGRGFPMTKKVMFGDAETVYAIRLNKCRIFEVGGTAVTSGEVNFEIQLRALDETKKASKSTLKKSYTVTATLESGKDYIDLFITIPKSDLADFGDDEYFIMLFNVLTGDGSRAVTLSQNSTFHFIPTERVNGDSGAYFYMGYVTGGTAGKGLGDSYSQNIPDIFFSTATKTIAADLSGLLQGSTGGSGDSGDSGEGGLPEMKADELLQLPEVYDLVVGDTFELFYKGITYSLHTDDFDYELRFSDGKSRGNNYARRYVWCPTADDVGVHKLTITIRDNFGRALDTETVKLNVVNKPTSPDEEKVFLFIGASNTSNGTWPAEVIRRLTGTGTTTGAGLTGPKGDGLTNIKTIGTIKATDSVGAVYYEGYGGWTFTSYTTAYSDRPYFVYIHGDFEDLTLHQHSYYKDSSKQLWKLESISDEKIKLIAVKVVGGNVDTERTTIAPSGTLTLASGASTDDEATITYTTTSKAEGNPFWSVEKGANDFKAYAEKMGVDKIDEVFINLGWNSTGDTAEKFVEKACVLIDSILDAFPNCHINLIGLHVGSRDGFGANYGVSWNYYEKNGKVFEFQKALIELCNEEKYAGSLSFISAAGQFDNDYCIQTKESPTNNRVPTTETVGKNGVHPTQSGYYQFADAIYRHVVTRLQGGN